MLETIDLCKVYKPKKGVPVTAVNNVSLKFPEKGMVFFLGKSGSGKSTMLNLLGGLDKYDSGEIIVKGVSSKNFKQQHFDSYRNTYVGFIFQEYNILDEFSVGANIALAIELQGRKATDAEINHILREVDLEGYANRKPNELSGGQKQRVAIARALVKNPEIIMADEPTGALDSNTGKQVFDTLKKLSRDKLVIVVSHDREFCEQYADRIIELADGKVISDVELCNDSGASTASGEESGADESAASGAGESTANGADESTASGEESGAENGESTAAGAENGAEAKPGIKFDGSYIEIAGGYHLTAEDMEAINRYIDAHPDERVKLGVGAEKKKKTVEKNFRDTDQSRIKPQDASSFKLIKSALPFKNAFKIGASGLKYKKFRLIVTIFLSVVAFALFGLSDTMGAYDHIKVCTKSLVDSGVKYMPFSKAVKVRYTYDNGQKEGIWWDSYNTGITAGQIREIEEATGIALTGVFRPINSSMYLGKYYDPDTEFTKSTYNIYATYLMGFVNINDDTLEKLDCKLVAGRMPDGSKNETAVSEYVFESFKIGGYTPEGAEKAELIKTYDDLIGKTLTVGDSEYVITGIVDTGFDFERYKTLIADKRGQSAADMLIDYALQREFETEIYYGVSALLMVGDGHVEKLVENEPDVYSNDGFIFLETTDIGIYSKDYICTMDMADKNNILWVDGEKTSLGEKEIIISKSSIEFYSENDDKIVDFFKNNRLDGYISYPNDEESRESGYKVVGIINDGAYNDMDVWVLSDSLTYKLTNKDKEGIYSYAIGCMPSNKNELRNIVDYSYDETNDIRYKIQNAVTFELETINEICVICSKVFLFIGLGFAVFAAVMLANFIGTSISYKKQEIGILRAIGARSNDVFKIFFSESFIIASVNFVLSCVAVLVMTIVFNGFTRYEAGLLISVLSFGPRQVILIFAVSIAVAALASFIPVKKIASKKPIDAIRNR